MEHINIVQSLGGNNSLFSNVLCLQILFNLAKLVQRVAFTHKQGSKFDTDYGRSGQEYVLVVSKFI